MAEPTGDDALEARTPSTPLKPGGASFITHRLHQLADGSLEYRRALGLLLMGGTMGGLGLLLCGWGASGPHWANLAFGAAFFAAGVFLLWPRRKRFDVTARQVTLGALRVPFSRVRALQVLGEYVEGDEAHWSYELNLVFDDGSRHNVVDHGGRELVRDDAQRLGALLGCPVWDRSRRQAG